MNKRKFVFDVIASCTNDIDDFTTVDRFKMNIYFDMKVLSIYTNLEVASDFYGMVEQYDLLCEKSILTKIISFFKEDYDLTYMILEDELESILIQNSIDAQVVKIANKINGIIDTFDDKLNEVNFNSILPEGMNVSELVNLLGILK